MSVDTPRRMPIVHFSHHGALDVIPGHAGPLGVLVWIDEAVAFFPVEGREHLVVSVAESVRDTRDQADLIEYLLERGGGAFRCFSLPETVEAASLLDAARQVAASSGIAFAVPKRAIPSCSACGGGDDLHVVTYRYPDGPGGRLLVYCARCREARREHLGVDVPVAELTVESFVALYREGLTESDPPRAAEIAFGEAPIDAVRGARAALAGLADGRAPASD